MKRHLTKTEEFDIMKIVLDKFLWFGVIIMAIGFYKIVSGSDDFLINFSILLAGIIIMVLFMIILIREYEFMH